MLVTRLQSTRYSIFKYSLLDTQELVTQWISIHYSRACHSLLDTKLPVTSYQNIRYSILKYSFRDFPVFVTWAFENSVVGAQYKSIRYSILNLLFDNNVSLTELPVTQYQGHGIYYIEYRLHFHKVTNTRVTSNEHSSIGQQILWYIVVKSTFWFSILAITEPEKDAYWKLSLEGCNRAEIW